MRQVSGVQMKPLILPTLGFRRWLTQSDAGLLGPLTLTCSAFSLPLPLPSHPESSARLPVGVVREPAGPRAAHPGSLQRRKNSLLTEEREGRQSSPSLATPILGQFTHVLLDTRRAWGPLSILLSTVALTVRKVIAWGRGEVAATSQMSPKAMD